MAPLPLPWILSIIYTLSFFSITLASVGLELATVHPSRPNTCFNKDTRSFFEDGESWQTSGCGMASCMKISQPSGKYQMMISHEGCGSVGYEPPCYIVEDKKAEFPDCCPEVTCPDSSETKSETGNEYYSKFLNEDINNELDTGVKNKTQKPESLVEKNPYNNYYERESQNKERQWRNANNDVRDNNWVGRLLSEEQSISDSDLHQNNVVEDESQQEDAYGLNSRKMSPKFWYWF